MPHAALLLLLFPVCSGDTEHEGTLRTCNSLRNGRLPAILRDGLAVCGQHMMESAKQRDEPRMLRSQSIENDLLCCDAAQIIIQRTELK
jgi:hypothetical protein